LNEWRAHSEKQEQALRSALAIVICATGVQWGKTTVGAVRLMLSIFSHTASTDNFLVVAPTYKILQQSTLPAFLKVMAGYGEYSKADAVFTTTWGTRVYFRTATDPDSIVGITNIRHIWGDEAGLFTLYFWDNIQARAAFREAPITLTTSPYTLNWLYKQIILPKMRNPKARADVELVQAASWENPFMPRGVIDRAKISMDPRRFNAMFGGQWERMSGLVYDCFDEIENQCDPLPLPAGTRVVGGIDWGYTEPFVLKLRAITPDGAHYGIAEFYKSGLTIMDMIQVAKRFQSVHNMGLVYCGPDQPGYIEEMCRNGIKAIPANNDVRVGIDRHYELIKTRRLKYYRGMNPYTLDEIDTYHYPSPDDVEPDQSVKDLKPVQQHDHAVDADRYISIMTYGTENKARPHVPQERRKQVDHHVETERLKRRRSGGGSEEWS
jgi:PBSX family phage terminase large subunit